MKKTKLMGLATLLLALGVVGCGEDKDKGPDYQSDKTYHWVLDAEGNVDKESKVKHTFEEDASKAVAATCSAPGSKTEKCTVCGYEKTSDVAKLTHNYVAATDATHANVTSTCKDEGKKWEKCSLCDDWKETNLGYAEHTWGNYGAETATAGNTKFSTRTCSVCNKVDVKISALDWVNISGSNKDTTGETLKLNSNGNYVEYKFNLGGAFTGSVYLYGWVDRFNGSDDNGSKSFFTAKSADNTNGNFSIAVNDGNPITITNKASYSEMGMTASGIKVTDAGVVSDSGYERATPALCEVGAIAIPAGEATIKYARVDSYNLNISEIHFIGTIA